MGTGVTEVRGTLLNLCLRVNRAGSPASSYPSMIQESVVAIVSEETLGEILPAVHRAGLGTICRVLRTKRSPLLDQLQRAGVPVSQAPTTIATTDRLIVIAAAARAPMASSLLIRHGATTVWTVSVLGEWIPIEDVMLPQPIPDSVELRLVQPIPGRRRDQHVRQVPVSEISVDATES